MTLENIAVIVPIEGAANVEIKPSFADPTFKEIYVVQVTTFDRGGQTSEMVRHITHPEFFLTREAAEEKVKYLSSWGPPKSIENHYFIQTLWPAKRIAVVSNNDEIVKPN